MGVHKLWDILLTIAVQQQIEDLSGLTLAIDASLWIVKINSIYQKIDDGLKCIFNKLLWIKKNNIKVIFVFDGQTPMLKRRTVEQRRNKRKQVNNFDLQKKVQIQIIKNVSGTQSQRSQQTSQYDQKTKQIDLMLATLLKYEQSSNTIQLSEKMTLQAQVLNKKYQLYTQVNPKILQKFGDLDYFSNLDIESKQQILQNIRESGLQSTRQIRDLKQKMSEQEKIMYEMQLIKKKSKIRQLQDNLYRNLSTKRIENGYEIIQGVYNGKKVIQKRKVKEKTFDQWGIRGSRKETCNDFKQIFRKTKSIEEVQKKDEQDQNNFFSKIFTKDYKADRNEQSISTFSQMSKRLSQSTSNPDKRVGNEKNTNFIKNNKFTYNNQQSDISKEQEQQICYGSIFDVEPRRPSQASQQQKKKDNPDQFPDFIMMQQLDELTTSSNNLHLQNMLDILGITYVVAPFQAEAQCAALQQMGIVDGVVTEDSDVFLFGARRVYRGVFQDNIKLYSMSKIQQKLMLTRQKLILFALMLGSDYTQGVKGIGIVNAMQILKVHHDIDSLQKFTNWAKSADILQQSEEFKTDRMLQEAMSQDEIQFYALHRKFKNYWHIHPTFPQRNVYEAYSQPPIQVGNQIQKKLKQKKQIQIQALKVLMEQKFKMVPMQIQLNLKILTKPFEKKKQMTITDYVGGFAKIASKRLQKAINMRQNSDG